MRALTRAGPDRPQIIGVTSISDFKCSWEGAAATVKHDPTGLYLYGGWGRQLFQTFGPNGLVTAATTVFDQNSFTNPNNTVSGEVTFCRAV